MKIFTLIFIFTLQFLAAQNEVQIADSKNRRDHPIEFRPGEWSINSIYSAENAANKELGSPKFKKIKYSDSELARIKYLLKNNILPEGLKGERRLHNREIIPYYNSYWVGNVKYGDSLYCLIYIPKNENKHMPADLIPPTDEGTFLTVYVNVAKFAGRKLAGKPLPPTEVIKNRTYGNVTFSTANLSRFNMSEGVMVFWFGTSSNITGYQAYTVKFGGSVTEESVAGNLKSKYVSGADYFGYDFKNGYKCQDLYKDIARKMKVSLEEAQELRFGSCNDQLKTFD